MFSVALERWVLFMKPFFSWSPLAFLQGFDQLRIEGLLCDVTLVPGDGEEAFPVHRAMMASASDYFKAMFTGTASGDWEHTDTEKFLLQESIVEMHLLGFIEASPPPSYPTWQMRNPSRQPAWFTKSHHSQGFNPVSEQKLISPWKRFC